MTGHLLLIDASGFIHRAYHAGSPRFRSDGLPTWAIEGFMGMLWRLLGAAQHDEPTHAVAVFDPPGPTFRHQIFPAYKNNRPARDQELLAQMPYLRHASETMGISPLEMEGFEADDVIATMAARGAKAGMRVTIVSSDKDFHQLVGPVVEIVDPLAHRRITEADVRTGKFMVAPAQVPDVQALAGDAVDNIPGLDGIGMKGATAMVKRFGSIEGCVEAVLHVNTASFFQPRQRTELKKDGALDRLRLYRTLATLRVDVPLTVPIEDLVVRPIMREHIDKILKTLEATGRFDAIFSTVPDFRRTVDGMDAAAQMEWWAEELAIPGQPVPDVPQCGYYERRITKGGVFVPAMIWREDELEPITGARTGRQILRCALGSEPADPVMEWGALSKHPITKEKYDFEMADRAWVKDHAPDDPKNNPRNPVDFSTHPAPRFHQPASQKRKTRP